MIKQLDLLKEWQAVIEEFEVGTLNICLLFCNCNYVLYIAFHLNVLAFDSANYLAIFQGNYLNNNYYIVH